MLCSTAPKAFFVLFANFTVPSRVFSWGASGRCAMGAYGAGMSVYSNFIARGHEVVFPKKTSIDWDRAPAGRNRRRASLNHDCLLNKEPKADCAVLSDGAIAENVWPIQQVVPLTPELVTVAN